MENPFYRLENVRINENWKQLFDQNKDAYACEIDANAVRSDDNDYCDEDPMIKKQLHGFSDLYNIYDL